MVATHEVAGSIEGVDTNDVARVLIGPGQEEWFFPLDLLPSGVGPGDQVRFADQGGRYVAIGKLEGRVRERSIEDRLSRPLNVRKSAEFDLRDLRAARAQIAAEAQEVVMAAATPPAPARMRASHQRRW